MSKEKNYELLKNKNILILGYQKSGKEISKLSSRLGANLIIYDEKIMEDEFVKIFNSPKDIDWEKIDFVITSPGISLEKEIVKKAYEHKKEVIGEIEFAYRHSKGKIFGITGTNGKTTTTTLLGKIMSEHSKNTVVVGNIGNPFAKECDKTNDETNIIIELSSYQLETIKEFRPNISAIVNINEDHLVRHKTMDKYMECKFNIAKNQGVGDYMILNIDNDYTINYLLDHLINEDISVIWFSTILSKLEMIKKVKQIEEKRYNKYIKNKGFSNKKEKEEWILEYGEKFKEIEYIYHEDWDVFLHLNSSDTDIQLVKKENIKLLGLHNLENIMIASCMAKLGGASVSEINKVISKFEGVEHRIEFVAEKNQIKYYNDSKATNPDATIKAVLAMNRPTALLLGGSDKKVSFKPLAKELTENIKYIYAYGDSQEQIIKDLTYYNKKVIKADNLLDAFNKARLVVKLGENILLSPACASFDEFNNFEERGEFFKKLVAEIKEEKK